MTKLIHLAAAMVACAPNLVAQVMSRRAEIRTGDPARGKCTIEVVVDGGAEVEVRGETAYLRTLSGRPAEWRRFECSTPLPANPLDFRFAGVDGRGRQELVRNPGQGNGAVVRIEDPQGGQQGYTFDLVWQAGPGGLQQDSRYNGAQPAPYAGQGGVYTRENARPGYPGSPLPYAPGEGRMDTRVRNLEGPEASLCQEAVRRKALRRFRVRDLNFREIHAEGDQSRFTVINGTMEDARGGNAYRYSCSLDASHRRVRSTTLTQISRNEIGEYAQQSQSRDVAPYGDRNRSQGDGQATEECRRAAYDRLRSQGYGQTDFRSFNRTAENQVTGVAEADGANGRTTLSVTCTINPRDGRVSNLDLRPRF